MVDPLESGLPYSRPPPPPIHTVFATCGNGYIANSTDMQLRCIDNSNKRKLDDDFLSLSPLSSTSYSSSASFPEVNDRNPSVKKSKIVTPRRNRQSSAMIEDSESEADSRQKNLERNRLAGKEVK
jgi:hypothetical protein